MNVTFRPLARADFALLATWLRAAHVQRWWDPRAELDFIEEKYGPRVDGLQRPEPLIVHVDQRPAGLVQWCAGEEYAWWPTDLGVADAAAIDGLIGDPAMVERGVGTAVLGRFIDWLANAHPEHPDLIAATEAGNLASRRLLERHGFECIFEGVLERDGRPLSAVYRRTGPTPRDPR